MVRIPRFGFVLGAWLLAAPQPALSQNDYPYNVDTRPKTGFLPDSMVGAIDSIGPADGGLHLNIPIASLPAGAAGMGFTLSLTYTSSIYSLLPGVWETPPYAVDPEDLEALDDYPIYYQDLFTGPGWRYNFQNYRIEEENRALTDSEDECAGGWPFHPRVFRTRAGLGDGSLHALHLYGYGRTAEFGLVEPEDFYPYNLRGDVNSTHEYCINPEGGYPDNLYDVRRTFYSSDGSYVKLEMGPDPGNEWILYLPDGGQARGTTNLASKLYDANGNWVEIVNACGDLSCSQPYTEIRDPYSAADPNRKIRIDYVAQVSGPSTHRITAPTATGAAQWTVDRELISVDRAGKTYQRTEEDYPLDWRTGTRKSLGLTTIGHVVVKEITYPTTPATGYAFGYNDGSGWGEVDRVTAPSGAVTAYTYEDDSHRGAGALMRNPVESRTVTHRDVAANRDVTDAWAYDYLGRTFVTTHPDGGVVTKRFENHDRQRIWKIEGPGGAVVEREWAHNAVDSIVGYEPMVNNPYVAQERRTVPDGDGNPSKTAITGFTYNGNGLLTSRVEYDWVDYGVTTGSAVKRQTDVWYHASHPSVSPTLDFTTGYWREHNPTYWSGATLPRRLNAVRRQEVSDGATTYAVTEYDYDNAYTTGNVTAEKRWDSVKSPALPTLGTLSAANAQVRTRAYNGQGNPTQFYAPEIRTTVTYGSLPGVAGPGPYPTRVVYAPGTADARTWTYDWDDASGWLNSRTDEDNGLTTAYTFDALGRPLTVNEAGERKTVIAYADDALRVTTLRDRDAFGDGALQTITQHDALGRVTQAQTTDTASTWITAVTRYVHTAGSPVTVVSSTPYRTTSDSTLEWTCAEPDVLGRTTAVAVFKGSDPPTDCESEDNRTGIARTAYDADTTTVTDPADIVTERITDALGRLTRVTEDPDNTDPNDDLPYVTTYEYDPLDNLTEVTQGVQTREFQYSSLSRLLSAENPESGTTHYTYYDSGNLKTRTDARGVAATFEYDGLQRILTTEYAIPPDPTPETPNDWPAPTPDVTYCYHTSGSPNIGLLQSISSSVAASSYAYDRLGRLTSQSQTIAGHPDTFTFANDYYLNDALKSQTYPSGRTVNYNLDDAGRVDRVWAGTTAYADMTGVTGGAYHPDGRLRQMQLGNGLWETRDYRTPGTTTTFKLGATAGSDSVVELDYNYSGTANNGNLQSQVIRRSGLSWTQTFGYDDVNRLETAAETGGYDREFGYDAFGNRWLEKNLSMSADESQSADESHEPAANVFNASTNRMTLPQVAYDAAGNQTLYSPYTLVYDAENRMTAVAMPSVWDLAYAYDGEGRRVKKAWTAIGGAAEDTYFVYDIAGNLAAEYATEPETASGTAYLFADMLGSVRAVTDDAGNVDECYDYLPFGRMLSADENGRDALGCHPPSPDASLDSDVSQKFTGQVRDEETRLDYFNARYMSAPQGRFLSPDALMARREWIPDPQRWNRYAYVRNNPLRYIDPNGEDLIIYYFDGDDLDEELAEWLRQNRQKILDTIRNRFSEAGINKVEFRVGTTLTKQQQENLMGRAGVGELHFRNTTSVEGERMSVKAKGMTQGMRGVGMGPSQVFLGNLRDVFEVGPLTTFRWAGGGLTGEALAFGAGEVGAHEIGHKLGFRSILGNRWFPPTNLMTEGMGNPDPSNPLYFRANPRDQRIIDEINSIGDNTPPVR